MNNLPANKTDEIASLLRRLADTLSPLTAPQPLTIEVKLDPPTPKQTPLEAARELLETVPQRKVDAGLAMYKAQLSRAQVRHALGLTFEVAVALETVSRAPTAPKGRPQSLEAKWRTCYRLFNEGRTNEEAAKATGVKLASVRAYRSMWKRNPEKPNRLKG